MIKEADTSKSGQIGFEEFANMMAERMNSFASRMQIAQAFELLTPKVLDS